MPLERLTIFDFSDREFLLIVMDVADSDGWSEASDVAVRLDVADYRSASSRLSWMKRYGALEREHERDEHGQIRYHRDGKPRHTQRWRVTEVGRALAMGKLSKSQQGSLERMNDGALLMAVRYVSGRTGGDSTAARLVQREWKHGIGR